MQVMQVVNMFGAVRPKEREKAAYGASTQSVVPTKEEAAVVLQSLSNFTEDTPERQKHLDWVRGILGDLAEGNAQSFLALDEDEFEEHNAYIGQSLTTMQVDLLEQQAQIESNDFKGKNAVFFDEIREEGLNYDHLSNEQIEVMRLRIRERGLTQKFEANADRVDGNVFYQYKLGPDDRYYKSGGVVMGQGKDSPVSKEIAQDVLQDTAGRENTGQFADVDAFSMPNTKKRRRSFSE